MKKILITVIATLFITLSAKGQNLLIIGDQSYSSTETYTLKANSIGPGNLNVLFAKDRNTPLFAVSKFSPHDLEIKDQLIIYLNDGTVIKLKQERTDYVDNTSKAVYELTKSELRMMKNSNINTVRFTLEHEERQHPNAGRYSVMPAFKGCVN